jgi:hypothetical protein
MQLPEVYFVVPGVRTYPFQHTRLGILYESHVECK